MKYALLAVGLLTVLPVSAGAWENAFGIRSSQPEKSLKIIQEPSKNFYEITVPEPHREFTKYEAIATSVTGICKLIASGENREEDPTGTESRAVFRKLEGRLTEKFGSPVHVDILHEGSNAPEKWSESFFLDNRAFLSVWTPERGAKLPEGVIAILLKISVHHIYDHGNVTHAPYIQIEYEFDNIDRCAENLG